MAKEVVRSHGLKVGDVLVSSWGYEQTNLDFYQVIALNGKSMVTVRKVHLPVKSEKGVSWASRDVSFALPDGIVESDAKPFRRVVKNFRRDKDPAGDLIEINSYADASRYDGGTLYESWYA